jgi:radical SAM superfamily enzyme YgiQ (UPF0313 family)
LPFLFEFADPYKEARQVRSLKVSSMPIIEPVIRPPSEADSFLLQVTVGCSSNQCSFCGAYKCKAFRYKPEAEMINDIQEAARRQPGIRRIFLLDGDALAVPNPKLVPVLDQLNMAFPHLTRIASYANGFNLTARMDAELKELSQRKLRLIYLGLESGSQEILDRMHKRSTAEEMIQAVRRAEESGIKSSVIVLLGLGGKRYSETHVRETVLALNRMQPRYLSFLSLMVIRGTALHRELSRGDFEELDAGGLLREARQIIEGLELHKTIFRSNHASNYLPFEGRLPQDKVQMLAQLQSAADGEVSLRPDFLRGL